MGRRCTATLQVATVRNDVDAASSLGSVRATTPVQPSAPELPAYPPATAKQRKQAINEAVAGTTRGQVPNVPHGYMNEEHMMWRAVYRRVTAVAEQHACPEYMRALREGAAYREESIPDIGELSGRLQRIAGWEVMPVTGSVSPRDFFACLEESKMPCTMYIRPHTKLTFTEDPDCVHEMLGHIPHLFIPSWSRLYRAFGRTARRLSERDDSEAMERLILMYFAVVEKGLVRSGPNREVKAIGASVISGAGELVYMAAHPERHLPLGVEAVMKYGSTDEDGFMKTYFVGDSVDGMADWLVSWMATL